MSPLNKHRKINSSSRAVPLKAWCIFCIFFFCKFIKEIQNLEHMVEINRKMIQLEIKTIFFTFFKMARDLKLRNENIVNW